MNEEKKAQKMLINKAFLGKGLAERRGGERDGSAADAVVSLAETCIKNKNFKRISQSAGKRINESVGGQREEEKNK